VIAGLKPLPAATRRVLRVAAGIALAASALLVSWSTAGAWSTADGTVAMIPIDGCGDLMTAPSLAVDAAGNMYLAGSFNGACDFDPGPGTALLTATGDFDVYLVKLDSSGNYVWATRFGNENTTIALSVAVDAAGNVVVAGYFTGSIDFDPADGVMDLVPTSGTGGGFVAKFDSSGNHLWAHQMGTTWAHSVTVDGSGNVITVG
ncbi:uncharacterized protein METZ01_LOCUS419673, partial [marine metagenome]